MRESWTDERLDDLSQRSDDGFKRVEAGLRVQRSETRTVFASQRSETKTEFASLRSEAKIEFASLRSETKEEFASLRSEMNARFDSMQRMILQVGGGIIASMLLYALTSHL